MQRGSPLSVGGLWRDTLNVLAEQPITPELYLPLADAVLPKWAEWTYFLGHAAGKLSKSERPAVEADVARARIGWRMWTDQRPNLRAYVERVVRRAVDDMELEEWWVYGLGGELGVADFVGKDDKQARAFRKQMHVSDEDERVLRYHPDMRKTYLDYYLLSWVHKDLQWAGNLERLRQLARKTWPADPHERQRWTAEEVDFVNSFFRDQETYLMPQDVDHDQCFDVLDLRVVNHEQGLGFGLDGLSYLMYVFVRAVVIDFVESVLEVSRLPTARGSLSCIDCGTFVGRRALGYGQLYCSSRCKKRAAKRRYRERNLVAAS